jgi:predicted house-cleaning noncanonical NTP pyrophosphatase (MazG superfamily)
MTTITYNKLVRDRVPEIIRSQGKSCVVTTLNKADHLTHLNAKLKEELEEYFASGEVMELADMVEIIRAILHVKEVSIEEFEKLREGKRQSNGGFDRGYFLASVEEPSV